MIITNNATHNILHHNKKFIIKYTKNNAYKIADHIKINDKKII
jgi:hypothetical protein